MEMYKEFPTLETKRLRMRKLTMEDAKDIFLYGSDNQVTRYVTWDTHENIEESEKFVQYALAQYEKKQLAPWGIERKEDGKMIGTIDFVSWNKKHGSAEVGYAISREYWGHGYVPEALQTLLELGFNEMELVRISARCLKENEQSKRVLEKVGMAYEGLIRKGMHLKGEYRDLCMYAILKEEYVQAKRGCLTVH
ncbi:GNAT family N-acetyltransferase [Metabacillus iocasae]|uniref:Ribosomal-protein-alanine N-acetyltransferase n=1 Tax=Priestia iocasae TaxID=2291674 RepID=A0ABS2QVM0_9BACI|nr:GNAT family protein [Metabacillus iocasae]MBM7703445.1 ribosomal-protein-alanine N-acetyltransferase [Metabacillus iocasae]